MSDAGAARTDGAIKYIISPSFIKIGPVMAVKSHSECHILTRTRSATIRPNYEIYEHQHVDASLSQQAVQA